MIRNQWLTRIVILGMGTYAAVTARGQNLTATPNAVGVRIVGTGVIKDTQVWIHSRATMYVAGDRISKTGNERFSFTGTLSRGPTPAVGRPFQVLGDISGKVRIENSESTSTHAFGSDGTIEWSDQGSTTTDDDDFVETFLNDTVEHFLELQASGAPMRFLGANFRFDDGTTPNYTGPFYDVYEMAEACFKVVDLSADPKYSASTQRLSYWSASSTLLRARVVR